MVGLWLIIIAVLAALAAGGLAVATVGSICSHKREAKAAEEALERFKIETNGQMAEAQVNIAKQEVIAEGLKKDAATARLETEQLRQTISWRSLSSTQMDTLVGRLIGHPMSFSVLVASDPEAITLGNQILAAFARAGVQVTSANRWMDPAVVNTDAIIFGRPPDTILMQKALESVGLTVTIQARDSTLEVGILSKPRAE